MDPGSAPAHPLQPFRLLRLLLAFCLLLGGWSAASAHMHVDGDHGAAAAPCHDRSGAGTAAGHDTGMAPAAHAGSVMDTSAGPATPPSHAPNGCCGSSAACHAHCGMGVALPVAQAVLPAPPFSRILRRYGSAARYAPPAPDRLIRPPIPA